MIYNFSLISNVNNLKKTKHLLGFLKPDKNQAKKLLETQALGFLWNDCEWRGGESRKPSKIGEEKTKCFEKTSLFVSSSQLPLCSCFLWGTISSLGKQCRRLFSFFFFLKLEELLILAPSLSSPSCFLKWHIASPPPPQVQGRGDMRTFLRQEVFSYLRVTGNKFSQMALFPAINYRRCCCYRWKINRRCHGIDENPSLVSATPAIIYRR